MNKRQQILRKLVKNAKAVSPLIATLMLVLITVAAAGAFYLWQTGWQSQTQSGVDTAQIYQKSELAIAGSTTVYPFTEAAIPVFEEDYPLYQINNQPGGSGAGIKSVGTGLVDIGASSGRLTDAQKGLYPDLNGDTVKDEGSVSLVETLLAYDAVVIIKSTDNTHGLKSITWNATYDIYAYNGRADPSIKWANNSPNWLTKGGSQYIRDLNQSGMIEWNEVPSTYLNGTKCIGAEKVNIYDREEESGTEETFIEMISLSKSTSTTLEGHGITATHAAGNPLLISKIASDKHALGFMSYGYAKVPTNKVKMIDFYQKGSTTTGSVPALINASASLSTFEKNVRDNVKKFYDGARELLYITIGEPAGLAKLYIDWCRQPANNQAICKASGYITFYG